MEESSKSGADPFDPSLNQDELILQQQRHIEKETKPPEDVECEPSTSAIMDPQMYVYVEDEEAAMENVNDERISESTALVGELVSVLVLGYEYMGDETYHKKVLDLAGMYKHVRRTRPDGNCFFRAFGYAYLERLLNNKEEFEAFRDLADKSKDKLVALGFPSFTVEDFHDTFMEVLDRVGKGPELFSQQALLELFNDQGYSDYIVVYLRLLTSGQLQENAEFYLHFTEGERSMEDFCHQEVEPMYKESDHIHIIALCRALNVGVRVRYMDRRTDQVIAHDFPEGVEPQIHLLYRPGHYDILYP